MKRALIVAERCVNCQPCAAADACKTNAIFRESPDDKPWVDFFQCNGCLECKPACPAAAIEEISQPCTGKGRMSW